MDRRGFFGWLSSLAAGTVASQPVAKAEPCLTPAYAGFDGSFRLYQDSLRNHRIRLVRSPASSPGRWGLSNCSMGYWYNDDKSVSKLLYRNADGKLFDLQFVPMEEPT